jgi:hypothetical protein
MSEGNQSQEPQKRNVSIWVKIFVPFHIIAITSWSLPDAPAQYMGSPPKVPLQVKTSNPSAFVSSSAEYLRTEFLMGNELYVKTSPVKLYLLTTGFWQYWDMFSPNPASIDVYADEMVYYRDGTKRLFRYPRIHDLPIPQKFMKERWRKFFERAGNAQYRYLWPVFAQYIALMSFDDPRNPPVKIELHEHSMTVQPPGVFDDQRYKDELYYTYQVDQSQLRKDKGF